MEPEFRDLVRRAQTGEAEATAALLALVRPYVEKAVRRRAGPSQPDQSVSEWTQEGWLRILKKLGTFRGAAEAKDDDTAFRQFLAWVRTTIRRLLANIQRGRRRHEPRPPQRRISIHSLAPDSSGERAILREPQGKGPTPSKDLLAREQEAITRDRILRLSKALDQLSEVDRQIVRRHFIDGLSWKKVAAEVGLTVDQVKHRWEKLRDSLRGLLGPPP
jgi:RNA polymerase sigma-70 factor (ECF subfamily)